MTEKLPEAIREDVLTISGVELRVYVLDDGRRVINADDMGTLITAWEGGLPVSLEDAARMARVVKGLDT